MEGDNPRTRTPLPSTPYQETSTVRIPRPALTPRNQSYMAAGSGDTESPNNRMTTSIVSFAGGSTAATAGSINQNGILSRPTFGVRDRSDVANARTADYNQTMVSFKDSATLQTNHIQPQYHNHRMPGPTSDGGLGFDTGTGPLYAARSSMAVTHCNGPNLGLQNIDAPVRRVPSSYLKNTFYQSTGGGGMLGTLSSHPFHNENNNNISQRSHLGGKIMDHGTFDLPSVGAYNNEQTNRSFMNRNYQADLRCQLPSSLETIPVVKSIGSGSMSGIPPSQMVQNDSNDMDQFSLSGGSVDVGYFSLSAALAYNSLQGRNPFVDNNDQSKPFHQSTGGGDISGVSPSQMIPNKNNDMSDLSPLSGGIMSPGNFDLSALVAYNNSAQNNNPFIVRNNHPDLRGQPQSSSETISVIQSTLRIPPRNTPILIQATHVAVHSPGGIPPGNTSISNSLPPNKDNQNKMAGQYYSVMDGDTKDVLIDPALHAMDNNNQGQGSQQLANTMASAPVRQQEGEPFQVHAYQHNYKQWECPFIGPLLDRSDPHHPQGNQIIIHGQYPVSNPHLPWRPDWMTHHDYDELRNTFAHYNLPMPLDLLRMYAHGRQLSSDGVWIVPCFGIESHQQKRPEVIRFCVADYFRSGFPMPVENMPPYTEGYTHFPRFVPYEHNGQGDPESQQVEMVLRTRPNYPWPMLADLDASDFEKRMYDREMAANHGKPAGFDFFARPDYWHKLASTGRLDGIFYHDCDPLEDGDDRFQPGPYPDPFWILHRCPLHDKHCSEFAPIQLPADELCPPTNEDKKLFIDAHKFQQCERYNAQVRLYEGQRETQEIACLENSIRWLEARQGGNAGDLIRLIDAEREKLRELQRAGRHRNSSGWKRGEPMSDEEVRRVVEAHLAQFSPGVIHSSPPRKASQNNRQGVVHNQVGKVANAFSNYASPYGIMYPPNMAAQAQARTRQPAIRPAYGSPYAPGGSLSSVYASQNGTVDAQNYGVQPYPQTSGAGNNSVPQAPKRPSMQTENRPSGAAGVQRSSAAQGRPVQSSPLRTVTNAQNSSQPALPTARAKPITTKRNLSNSASGDEILIVEFKRTKTDGNGKNTLSTAWTPPAARAKASTAKRNRSGGEPDSEVLVADSKRTKNGVDGKNTLATAATPAEVARYPGAPVPNIDLFSRQNTAGELKGFASVLDQTQSGRSQQVRNNMAIPGGKLKNGRAAALGLGILNIRQAIDDAEAAQAAQVAQTYVAAARRAEAANPGFVATIPTSSAVVFKKVGSALQSFKPGFLSSLPASSPLAHNGGGAMQSTRPMPGSAIARSVRFQQEEVGDTEASDEPDNAKDGDYKN